MGWLEENVGRVFFESVLSLSSDKVRVYVDMKKALRAMITVKGARFKAFSTREEAETFAKGSSGQISAQPTISTLDGPQTGAWGPVTSTGMFVYLPPSKTGGP